MICTQSTTSCGINVPPAPPILEGVLLAELMQGGDGLVDVVGEGEQQVLVFACFHEVLQQGIDRYLLGPETLAQEDHGAGKAVGQVVVLYRLLEYLLQGARAARGIDGAAKGQGEDVVLADAVLKEFGDVGGKGR